MIGKAVCKNTGRLCRMTVTNKKFIVETIYGDKVAYSSSEFFNHFINVTGEPPNKIAMIQERYVKCK